MHVVLLFWLVFMPVVAEAFRVSPMQLDLEPLSGRNSSTIIIENTGDEPVAVEMRVEHRVIHPDGTETRTPRDDDFLVFPPMATVQPNRTQAVRVQYLGQEPLTTSQSFIVFAKQLPVDFSDANTGVQFAFEFGVSVQVVPPKAAPAVAATVKTLKANSVVLDVENTGTKYARLTLGRWILHDDAGQIGELTSDALREAIAQPLIQPQTTRVIELPLPDNLKGKRITTARFDSQ
jgi:fimbrial chaperone protein